MFKKILTICGFSLIFYFFKNPLFGWREKILRSFGSYLTNSDLEIFKSGSWKRWLQPLSALSKSSSGKRPSKFLANRLGANFREPATPKRENCQVPNRWRLKKTPGDQKGQYFGGILGAQNCKKRREIMLHNVKIIACKVCGLFCRVFHAKQNEEVTGLSVSLGQGETCPLRIKQFHCATALEQFWWRHKSEGTNELKNLKPFSLKLAFTSPNKKPSK